MNLYKLHTNPESLYGYEKAMEKVPELAWRTHENNRDKLREMEDTWAKSAEYSFLYGLNFLKPLGIKGFPKGEDIISTDARYSCWYAEHVLKKKFPKGEDAIATDAEYSFRYARDVLENRFPKGEDVIRGSKYQRNYEELFGVEL